MNGRGDQPAVTVIAGGKLQRKAAVPRTTRFVYTGSAQRFPAGTTADIGSNGGLLFSWEEYGEKQEWVSYLAIGSLVTSIVLEIFRTSSVWREVEP